jgi:hypothetical protein
MRRTTENWAVKLRASWRITLAALRGLTSRVRDGLVPRKLGKR